MKLKQWREYRATHFHWNFSSTILKTQAPAWTPAGDGIRTKHWEWRIYYHKKRANQGRIVVVWALLFNQCCRRLCELPFPGFVPFNVGIRLYNIKSPCLFARDSVNVCSIMCVCVLCACIDRITTIVVVVVVRHDVGLLCLSSANLG